MNLCHVTERFSGSFKETFKQDSFVLFFVSQRWVTTFKRFKKKLSYRVLYFTLVTLGSGAFKIQVTSCWLHKAYCISVVVADRFYLIRHAMVKGERTMVILA